MAEEDQAASQEEKKPSIRVEKIYLKDVSFETPNSPSVFGIEWKPELEFNMSTRAGQLQENLFEVIVTLTATINIGDRTAYLAEVHQAGIFNIQGADEDSLTRMFNVFCPRMLYPYACNAICELVTRGGFPQLLLKPINFEELHKDRMQEEHEKGGAAETQETEPS